MSAAERRQCSERIFTGARWDMAGHMCSVNAKHQDDEGRWWCKRHHPDSKAAKAAADRMKEQELIERKSTIEADIQRLLNRIGVRGYPTRSLAGRFGDPPTGAYIPTDALRELADRIAP